MICGNCGKREAEVIVKQVIDQEVKNLNLCRVCAQQLGFVAPAVPSITISFSVNDVDPARIRKKKSAMKARREELENVISCPECGMSFGRFKSRGLLGCPHCYEAFRFPLGAFLQETQGSESHWDGSSAIFSEIAGQGSEMSQTAAPTATYDLANERIERLESELGSAVTCEDYERAAELRDMLRRLASEHGHGI